MKTTPLKLRCPIPFCGGRIDAATSANGDDVPSPGDYNICAHCRGLSVFTQTADGLGLRLPSKAEAAALLADPEARAELEQAGARMDGIVRAAQKEHAEGN